jgi:hypothetical protein
MMRALFGHVAWHGITLQAELLMRTGISFEQVQNLIERCLQLYMNQSEVITTLQYQAKIEPGFTSLGEHFLILALVPSRRCFY